jgi:GTP 3',8-cyclase
MPLVDAHNRIIDYLRISVTDRCNFRCVYCMPEDGADVAPSSDLLTTEEIVRVARIAIGLGITKIRLTGGEPLVRKDLPEIIAALGSMPGLRDLSLTTNGFLLASNAQRFADAGLNRVNISLDTLRPERFARLARRGDLKTVWDGIQAALRAELHPIKLNCVVMRGWNEDELPEFARLTLRFPLHVRFIELMPINWSSGEDAAASSFLGQPVAPSSAAPISLYANTKAATFARLASPSVANTGTLDGLALRRAFVSMAEMQATIEAACGGLEPASVRTNGPATTFRLPDACGTVGFISQITRDRCRECNRLRLTADGNLRPCLMADGEIGLRELLRSGADDETLAEQFRLAVYHKPLEHRLEDGLLPTGRNMQHLGG